MRISRNGEAAGAASAAVPRLENGFRIGEWEVDPRREQLVRGGERRHLEHKVMCTLLVLAEHADEVVTREQFLDRVWAGRVVNEEALSRAISLLRAALEDEAQQPRYIQTIPRTGYRLIAPVEPLGDAGAARAPRRHLLWALGGVLLLASLSLALYLRDASGAGTRRFESIAVLPFVALDGSTHDYLAAGLTEELGAALARVEGLRVVSTRWVRDLDPATLRRRAGVDAWAEGSVREEGGGIRVVARVVDARSGEQLWSEVFARDGAGLAELHHEIAAAIEAALRPAETSRLSAAERGTDALAYRDYLRGRYLVERRGAANLAKGIALLEEATRRDPAFAEATLLLARAHALLPSYAAVDEPAELARAEALLQGLPRSVADATLGPRAFIALRRREWIEGEQLFRAALEARPGDVETLQWYSVLLAAVGNLDRARAIAARAVQQDPLSPITNYRLATICVWQGDADCATRQLALAAELGIDPTVSPEPRLLLAVRSRRFEELERELRALTAADPGPVEWIAPWRRALETDDATDRASARAALFEAHAAGGIPVRFLFGATLTLGDGDAALEGARALLASGRFADAIESAWSAEGAALRGHPQFPELARDAGLAGYWQRFGGGAGGG